MREAIYSVTGIDGERVRLAMSYPAFLPEDKIEEYVVNEIKKDPYLRDCDPKFEGLRDVYHKGVEIETDPKLEFLTDHFFDLMRHDSSIEPPYCQEKEYAENIARDYLDEHPEFEVPPMVNEMYVYDNVPLDELKEYCFSQCAAYGYDGSDEEYDEDGNHIGGDYDEKEL